MREEFVFYEISSFEKSADGQVFKFEYIHLSNIQQNWKIEKIFRRKYNVVEEKS